MGGPPIEGPGGRRESALEEDGRLEAPGPERVGPDGAAVVVAAAVGPATACGCS